MDDAINMVPSKEKITLKTLKSSEREARRNIIIDAAERVFATKPFDKASMREIANESGMSASSIYRFFPNQEALIVAAAVRATKNLTDTMEQKIARYNDDPEKAFEMMVNSFIDYISENDTFFRMMTILMSQGNINPHSSREIVKAMNVILDMLDPLFIALNYTQNTRTLSRHFFTSMIGIIVAYNKLPRGSRRNMVELMKQLARMSYELIINCPREKLELLIT